MNNKSKIIETVAAVLLAILAAGALIIYMGYQKVDNTVKLMDQADKEDVKNLVNENISEATQSKLKEVWTVAIFGIDSRDDENLSGSNSDVIIIASINNKTGDITLVSVYRDTCLKTGDNRYKKVNEAYAVGGPKMAIEVLNENLDLQIDDYLAVNWKAVATAINLLGGIDMEITDAELKYINGYITETVNSTGIGSVQLKNTGLQHLDGVQAVAYSRIRYTAGNDFRRTERQRDVIAALLEKAKKSNWETLNNIIVAVFPMTSSSIDTNDVIDIAMNILKYKLVKTTGFPFEVKGKKVDKQDFVFPNTLTSNVAQLHLCLYGTENYQVSNAVAEISERIERKYTGKSNNVSKPVTPPKESNEIEKTEESNHDVVVIESEVETITPEVTDYEETTISEENYGPAFAATEADVELETTEEIGPGILVEPPEAD
jgi:LCP family protein required for cell wall assembly